MQQTQKASGISKRWETTLIYAHRSVRRNNMPIFDPNVARAKEEGDVELTFRETLPSDVERLFSVRARNRENPISKEQLAELGITPDAIAGDVASGRIKGGFARMIRILSASVTAMGRPARFWSWLCCLSTRAGALVASSLLTLLNGFDPWVSILYGWRHHPTRAYGPMAFIGRLDGVRKAKLTRTAMRFLCSSRIQERSLPSDHELGVSR
jgi:hypothetical protein